MENSPICVDFWEFGRVWHICLEFLRGAHSRNVELVLVLRALLRGPWRARRTHNTTHKHTHGKTHRKNTRTKRKNDQSAQEHRHTRKSGSPGALGPFSNYEFPGPGNFPSWVREIPYLDSRESFPQASLNPGKPAESFPSFAPRV